MSYLYLHVQTTFLKQQYNVLSMTARTASVDKLHLNYYNLNKEAQASFLLFNCFLEGKLFYIHSEKVATTTATQKRIEHCKGLASNVSAR